MMAIDLRSWWHDHCIVDFFHSIDDFSNLSNRSPTSKVVTNAFRLQHPPISMQSLQLELFLSPNHLAVWFQRVKSYLDFKPDVNWHLSGWSLLTESKQSRTLNAEVSKASPIWLKCQISHSSFLLWDQVLVR